MGGSARVSLRELPLPYIALGAQSTSAPAPPTVPRMAAVARNSGQPLARCDGLRADNGNTPGIRNTTRWTMSDELDLPVTDAPLSQLLAHYAPATVEDRDRWRDRLMQWPDASERDLTRWHGALVAADWLEQNTGQTPKPTAGQVAGCYRLTRLGRRALRILNSN